MWQNFTALVQAINTCQATLTAMMDHLKMDIGLFCKDMDKFLEWLGEVECRIGNQRARIRSTPGISVTCKVDNAEKRNQWNNLWLIGLPEDAEGQDEAAFSEQLLCSLLPQARFSAFFAVERAHTMLATRGPSGSASRTFIFLPPEFQEPWLGSAGSQEVLSPEPRTLSHDELCL